MKIDNILKLIISITLPLSFGAVIGIITAQAITTWYKLLNQPSFNPPNWVFAPAWTLLYIILGISLFLIWKEPSSKTRNRALIAFSIQIALNFGWSLLFFYVNNIGLALIEIVILWVSILAMIYYFKKINPIAAYLNIPYLLWVTFATALNTAYYILN